ncbi:MAG: hypothetical protein KC478_07710 [Bacteriovoracaceae bacterium]|nr:hypothetical protein [Bacteriovoracaceae bacterium]
MNLKFLNAYLIISLMAVLGLSTSSHARKFVRADTAGQAQQSEQKFISVKGVVSTKETLKFTGADVESMLITLETEENKTPIVINLGDANDFVRISEGNTQIRALGRMEQVGKQPILMASQVYIDGKLVKLSKEIKAE